MPGSYRGVSGKSNGYKYLDIGEHNGYPTLWRGPLHVVGVSGFRSESITDIRDGTSNTLLAGESTTRTNSGYRTLWAYSFSHYSLSAATPPQSRTLLGDYDRCVQIGGANNSEPCWRGWGSFHSGGMNFVLCDGSVRFLHTAIDMNLFAELATIDGGEVARF
jgi:prepilin-type processing-associated H-X9-DG protein